MFILRWILNALILLLVAFVTPGIEITSFWYALLAAVVLGLVNAVIRPLLILFTLPINILTLGLFTLVINGLMFWLAASLTAGFQIASFGSAFLGALIYVLIVMAVNSVLKSD